LIEYINETHDFSILDEVVPFYDEGKTTVYEHMVLALDFAISECSERGLPLIRKGDWNDTLDHIGPRAKAKPSGVLSSFVMCWIKLSNC
jgi:cellobiose phosphorylase